MLIHERGEKMRKLYKCVSLIHEENFHASGQIKETQEEPHNLS